MLQIIQKGLGPGQILWCNLSNGNLTKYIVMSRDQNVGRNRSIKIDNSSFERLEEFKYLVTNVNSSQEEIKSRWTSGNAYYHSVQNVVSSSLQSKNIKINIYRTIILRVLYGCETRSLILREELRV